MAHEFESGFFGGNVPAWHELGTVIEEHAVSGDRALVLAGLDWKVQVEQLQHKGVDVPGKFLTFRERHTINLNTGGSAQPNIDPFGVVSSRYVPLQNRELFEFGDAIVKASGGAHWHTAGSLRGGANVWGLIDLGSVQLTPDEEIAKYIAILNSHDASSSIHAIVTNVRIVCQNTWTWALDGAPRKISIRHTGDLASKLEEAQRVLGIAAERTQVEMAEAEALLSMPFSSAEMAQMIEVIVPIEEDATERGISIAKRKREQLWHGYKLSDNLENVRTTKYGALQAVVEVNDHVLTRGANPERRLDKVFDGTDLVNAAHEYLTLA